VDNFMCLGVPMQVIETDGWTARCSGRDGERLLRLTTLAEEVAPGDWVLAHMDSAVQLLTEEEAETVAAALDAIAATLNGEDHEALLARVMAGVELPSQREDSLQ
jgi:hydrogenase expression/formation protein HypC